MRKNMKFGKNDEAVSPVIGVILMVAITVILAAVIAAFVLSMGTPTQAPQASIVISSSSVSGKYINITHRGGDSLDLGKVKAIIEQGTGRLIFSTLNTSGTFFQVGDTIGITVKESAAPSPLYNGRDSMSPTGWSGNFTLSSGKVTLTLIETDSAKEIGKITATVTS